MVYRTEDLKLLNSLTLDVSPAILIPFYDEDSNTLFLTGKVKKKNIQIFTIFCYFYLFFFFFQFSG